MELNSDVAQRRQMRYSLDYQVSTNMSDIKYFEIFMFAAISQRDINGFLISWTLIKAEEVC